MLKTTTGQGLAIADIPSGDALLVIDAYEADGRGVAASVEEIDWKTLQPWWKAAFQDAKVGDEKGWSLARPGARFVGASLS